MVYLALLRGINVGGHNIIRMTDLKRCFEDAGFEDVLTYIQSGNVVFTAENTERQALASRIETILSGRFNYDSKVVVISRAQLAYAVSHAPEDFGTRQDAFKYDVIFLRPPLRPGEVMKQIPLGDGVDRAYAGKDVVYVSRVTARVAQSRLSRIVGLPIYRELTIRNWNTTTKLLELMKRREAGG